MGEPGDLLSNFQMVLHAQRGFRSASDDDPLLPPVPSTCEPGVKWCVIAGIVSIHTVHLTGGEEPGQSLQLPCIFEGACQELSAMAAQQLPATHVSADALVSLHWPFKFPQSPPEMRLHLPAVSAALGFDQYLSSVAVRTQPVAP